MAPKNCPPQETAASLVSSLAEEYEEPFPDQYDDLGEDNSSRQHEEDDDCFPLSIDFLNVTLKSSKYTQPYFIQSLFARRIPTSSRLPSLTSGTSFQETLERGQIIYH